MNRKTSPFASLLLLGLTSFLFGQEPPSRQELASPEDVLPSKQLIAWSRLQNPQPVPQPLPPPDRTLPQPDQQIQPVEELNQRPTSTQTLTGRTFTGRTFTGKIVKIGDKYILMVNQSDYQLDAQSKAEHYVDKEVSVVGDLDTSSNTIRVVSFELLS